MEDGNLTSNDLERLGFINKRALTGGSRRPSFGKIKCITSLYGPSLK